MTSGNICPSAYGEDREFVTVLAQVMIDRSHSEHLLVKIGCLRIWFNPLDCGVTTYSALISTIFFKQKQVFNQSPVIVHKH